MAAKVLAKFICPYVIKGQLIKDLIKTQIGEIKSLIIFQDNKDKVGDKDNKDNKDKIGGRDSKDNKHKVGDKDKIKYNLKVHGEINQINL